MRRTASLKYYLKNPKKNGKLRDVEVSIVYKFTAQGERFEDPTGLWINPRYWDFKRQEVKGIHPDHLQLNQKLLEIKRGKLSLYEKHGHNFDEFEAIARGLAPVSEEEKKSLLLARDRFLEQYDREKNPHTVTMYKATFRYVEKLAGSFEQIDWNFFDAFKKTLHKEGLQDATVRKYVANLKCFLRWATNRGYPVSQVFTAWRTPNRLKTLVTLSMKELRTLETALLPTGPGIGRDFLCFEARTGARISDILAFDKRDLVGDTWTYNRKKGKAVKAKRVTVPFKGFCAPALRILKKYDYQMPQYTRQYVNQLIRQACDMINLNQKVRWEEWHGEKCTVTEVEKWTKISSHVGRKTFITLGLQFLPAKVVKDLAGIDSWTTIRNYEGDSEPQFVERALMEMDKKIKTG